MPITMRQLVKEFFMFPEKNVFLKNGQRRSPWLSVGRWLPMLIAPVAACLSAPDTSSPSIGTTRQAFTGRDVPSSHAITPNGQYTWTPAVNGTPHKHIAVSPDGAFHVHAESIGTEQMFVSALALDDAMVSNNLVDFANFSSNTPIELNATLASSITTTHVLGGLSAISFNPRYGVGSFRVDSINNCHTSAGSLAQVGVPNGDYDCYRMLVYAQVKDTSTQEYNFAFATLHVAFEHSTRAIVDADFDSPFERILDTTGHAVNVHYGATANEDFIGSFNDHFTATADGRLIVFSTEPYYLWSPDPLAPNSFDAPASLWSVTETIRSRSVCLGFGTAPAVDCVRFDQAYPIFREPFQFANTRAIASAGASCGYPWITPDGTDLFCNAGRISALAMIGQSTHGTLQHVDARSQTTQQRYCKATTATTNNSCTKEPTKGALGTTECSPRGTTLFGCGGQGDSVTLGTQRVMSIGAATGPWRTHANLTRFPLMHRAPSLLMMSRNPALAAFGETPAAKQGTFLYFEVATDAAIDPDFVAFFHMNEAIMPFTSGTYPSAWSGKAPFKDTNPAAGNRALSTADAGGFGYIGTLNLTAQFPFDRFGQKEHPTNAPPNPGFLGRAIYFKMPDGNVAIEAKGSVNRLAESRSAMTLELAVNPHLFDSSTGKTVLVAAPNSYELSFDRSAQSVTFAANGATSVATFTSVPIDNDQYTHLAVTYEGNAETNQATVKLYRNGSWFGTATLAGNASLLAATSTNPLCIGPGCCMTTPCTAPTSPAGAELLIDEVGISSVVRSSEYIAAAASVEGPVDVFVPSTTPSWYPSLPLGLEQMDIRIPKVIVDEINAGTNPAQKFTRIAALGKALFIDDVLSVNPTGTNVCGGRTLGRTCSFCHLPGNHFANPGMAFDDDVTGESLDTNTPSLLNRVFSTRQLKDRSEPTLVHQAERVITNQLEMHGDLGKVAACLNRTNSPESMPAGYPPAGIANYRQWFNHAFAESSSANNPVTKEQVLMALATYELTLVRGGSVIDTMLNSGSGANSILADGLRIFQGKGRCAGCHSGANFTDELRHVTTFGGTAIKTPSLRNVAETHPYFQDASKANLRAVIDHYNRCGAVKLSADSDPNVVWSNCAPELVGLGLTDPEINALIAFLQGLTSNTP